MHLSPSTCRVALFVGAECSEGPAELEGTPGYMPTHKSPANFEFIDIDGSIPRDYRAICLHENCCYRSKKGGKQLRHSNFCFHYILLNSTFAASKSKRNLIVLITDVDLWR